ncbi:MAG: NYN domain-containing protein [Coleofasciculaceae cyanobacterium]
MPQQTQPTSTAQVINGKNFASLYWDYENISNIDNRAKLLIDFAQLQGYLVNLNVYAKASIWQQNQGKNKVILNSLDFSCIDVCSSAKNAVDFQLVIDCVAEAHNNISTNIFILVTSDGDYETLVRELQSKGKKVIVIYHPDKVSKSLIQIANESYSAEELLKLFGNKTQILDILPQINYDEAIQNLIEAISIAVKQNKPTTYAIIDRLMRQNQQFPNYQGVSSIRKLDGTTFSKFSKFVEAVKADGKVQVRSIGKVKEVFLIEKSILVA